MSQENVEIVRQVYEEWERGNFNTPEVFDPSIRVVWVDAIFVSRAEAKGVRELTQAMQGFLDAWEDVTAAAERIIEAGDRVVAVVVWRGRGKTSGIEVESRQGSVWTMSEGKATTMENYSDPAEALEAAGLSE